MEDALHFTGSAQGTSAEGQGDSQHPDLLLLGDYPKLSFELTRVPSMSFALL